MSSKSVGPANLKGTSGGLLAEPGETRRLIADLSGRIERQERRIAKILISGQLPEIEMQMSLDELIDRRNQLQTQLDRSMK